MAEKRSLRKIIQLQEFPQPEIVKLKYPVFMCHGFGAVASVIKPGPLHDPCMKLRSHGVTAVAPNVVPYALIKTRAENWSQLIKDFCLEHSFEKVNIIAHSMGGLDIRYALTKMDISDKVESLTTISTPHQGSTLADLVLKAPELVTEKLGWFFDWFGNSIYPQTKSDALGSLEQLACSYIQDVFNKEVPDVDSVNYYSYSAAVGRGTNFPLNPVYKFQNNQIFEKEGPNDGFVSVTSARWGQHIETIPLSHITQMHIQVSKENQKLYDKFWLSVLKMLAKKGH